MPALRREFGNLAMVVERDAPQLEAVVVRQHLRPLHPAITVDDSGNAHVHRSAQRPPRLDCPKSAYRQMLGMLAAAVEPAVVGNIDQEIDGRTLLVRAGVAPGQKRIGVFIADDDAETEIAERKASEMLTDGNAI